MMCTKVDRAWALETILATKEAGKRRFSRHFDVCIEDKCYHFLDQAL